jgi:hypothetical protein
VKGDSKCVDTEISAGKLRFRRGGSRLAGKPVREIRASDDEGADRHIEDEDVCK